jgi:hypothetical protein
MPKQKTFVQDTDLLYDTGGKTLSEYYSSIDSFKKAYQLKTKICNAVYLNRDQVRHRLKNRVAWTELEKDAVSALFVQSKEQLFTI